MKKSGGDRTPYEAGREKLFPRVYGNIPSFLGVPVSKDAGSLAGYNAAVFGVPWEGPITWGDPGGSGCDQVPGLIRVEAARYGGFIPELETDILEALKITDYGDVLTHPGSIEKTLLAVKEKSFDVFSRGLFSLIYGGDHSFTPEIIDSLCKNTPGKVGLINFDSHFDNLDEYDGEPCARCCPVNRIAHIPGIKTDSIVHFGIRGPRNSRYGYDFAREIGATVLTIRQIRSMGFAEALKQAIALAKDGTERFYVSVCSDAIDPAYNPAGPPDPDGLTSHEILSAAYETCLSGAAGFDFVEIYPHQANAAVSLHLAIWIGMYALAGFANKGPGS